MSIVPADRASAAAGGEAAYRLEDQIGFILRKAHQRATAVFMGRFGPHQLTPTQWTTLVRIRERGALSQNQLGRLTAMDPATIQGVVQRLLERKLLSRTHDPQDARRKRLRLTRAGERLVEELVGEALLVSRDTLAPLAEAERAQLLALLAQLG